MSDLKTDFNVSPYYDDFDATKNFYRILFRPATAVQARELTQLQTILQEQIKRFGAHIFKDGSIIDGVAITYHPKLPVVYLENTFDTNTSLAVSSIDNTYLLYSNTGVRASVKASTGGFVSQYPNTNRFYLDYLSTGSSANTDVFEFQSGETLYLYDSNQDKLGTLDGNNLVDSISVITANGSANATGYGYGVSVSDGIIFQKGFFSKVNEQTLVVRNHDQLPNNYVVGFETSESIVTSDEDTSLFDNSNGSPNENAPGAHRLNLEPTLVAKLRSDTANSTNFFAIIEFDQDVPSEQNDDPVYNKLGEEFARRTFEESGDYIVKPFTVETLAHPSDANLMNYEVSPGIGYVKGNRVELIGAKRIEAERGLDAEEALNQIITANYGNYIIVDEALGPWNFDDVEEVILYDTAQNSITEYEGADAAPAGSEVGRAHIRNFVYNSGTKGFANAQYKAYIFNIRMGNTYSFSSDVKSLWANGTYGPAKADVVLESGSSVLKDGTTSTLVFPIGVDAVKRLRNANGSLDTQFIFRDIATATMQSNGQIVVTTNPAAGGGSERLNYSTGALSDTSSLEINIITSADAYTANQTGTVSITSGSNSISGSGTSFDTELAIGQAIRISGASPYVRMVTAIANSTSLQVDANLSESNSGINYQKYYGDGHIFSFAGSPSITINSNTQFTAELGETFDSGSQTVYAQYEVLRTAANETAKETNENRYVKIATGTHTNGTSGPWGLGLADVNKIRNVYVDNTGANTYSTSNPERSFWFELDDGQRDNYYDLASLVVKPQYAGNISGNTTFLVELDHFTVNTTGGIGFFSVDSYPIDDSNTANTDAIQTAELPRFDSAIYGETIELRDSIDFRPRKANTAVSNTVIANATENPADAANGFSVPATGQYIAEVDSNFQADMEYYLPRIDLLTITKEGDLAVRKGEPGASPRTPFNESDAMAIASIYMPPFPSLTTREGEAFNRNDIKTKIRALTNRRYTMKDIGTLEQRIKTLEYYTVLNALEQKARDLTIPDVSGLDRFKNGIFADPFNSHALAKVSDFEHKIAIDAENGIARPYFETTPIDFQYDSASSSGITRTGNYLSRPFSNETYISQRYASKYRICTESIWKWNGVINLYPSYDHFRDENKEPAVNIDLDFSQPWEDFAATPFAANFGDWRTVERQRDRNTRGNVTTTTTTTTQEQIVQRLNVETMSETYNFGSYVKDVSIQPYMRSREVAFIVSGMKPDTTLHAFFDDENVDSYIAPGSISSNTDFVEGMENKAVTRTGAFGSALVSDSNGDVAGVFRIPDGQFRVGDRVFQLTNISDLTTGADAVVTAARAVYTASSLSITTQELTLNTTQPAITTGTFTDSRVSTSTTTRIRQPAFRQGARQGSEGDDPIAQSFYITRPDTGVSGVFITQVGLYFQSKDANLGVSAFILEMRNGYPDTSKIVAKSHLPSSNVSTSADASSETVFDFDNPVYLTNEKYYALMIQPDGNSPEYTLWMSEVGGLDVSTNEQIFSNPYVGVAYVSANRNVWTPIQTEDVKFNIYRAKFTTGTGTAQFQNEDDEYFTINGLTKANTSIGVAIGDVVYTQNSTGGLLTGNTDPYGVVQYLDEANDILHLNSSLGGFTSNTVIEVHRPDEIGNTAAVSNTSLIANATIQSVDNQDYSVLVPRFSILEPIGARVGYTFRGMSISYVADAAYTKVIGEREKEFVDQMRTIASYSNELVSGGGIKSALYQLTLTSDNDYVSPVIDLRRKSSLVVENLINNDSTNEHTRYGNALTRYISRNVILADGQEAEDLNVYLSAYRPVGTNIEVYAKFHNQEDGDIFNDKVWTQLDIVSGSSYSSPIDTKDYIEYQYGVPSAAPVSQGAFLNANNSNILEYSSSDGSRYIGYKTFALKIVLLSSDASKAPRLNDVRSICLQV